MQRMRLAKGEVMAEIQLSKVSKRWGSFTGV